MAQRRELAILAGSIFATVCRPGATSEMNLRQFATVLMASLSLMPPLAGPGHAYVRGDPTVITVQWVGDEETILKEVTLSREELQALPQQSFRTKTFWTEGSHEFTGPSIGAIAALGPGPAVSARVDGFDDYSATLTAEEWEGHGAILAIWFDGQYMRIRDKGPYWIMFPADDNPGQFYSQEVQEKLVWHVGHIVFAVDR